ncbi:peptide chain release factor N(5)-glutamine methyltransferase [Vagococcus fluvialis]|uniref:Release factor glutamine methyltransferase n=1 Tax=Vagococcus fluvialis bH819 TaxID=1255619 RepID=A0A1X6WSB3_9ENTE|nr:peptide chain release factor N(5)-glutamine methyltransferase [Vagococcus fluvialis]SLM87139.1 Protein-N(5)-glutamine methyltransferase PrmC, methylates polypeptide chain release factors RF1 and RF2 [Vagococcus fluvialis bH819]
MVNVSKTYFEVLNWASSFLEKKNEEVYVAEYLLLERKKWTKTELLLNFKKVMPIEEIISYKNDINQIIKHVPVQYLIGSCEFYGRRFKVSEDTLIPRPETEELVEMICQENEDSSKLVVDIGTGTGIIGISLKLEKPSWEVVALDISKGALNVAEENAALLDASINFVESDVLSHFKHNSSIDILVSNPPYISYDEWEVMDQSVREFEPKTALFAENNGLAIYQKIAVEAKEHLAENGKIYLEIGYLQGKQVADIFQEQFPQKKVEIIQDMNRQDRMIKVI